jgi:hypothetical protein
MSSWALLKTSFRKALGLKAIKRTKRKILFPGVVSGLNGYKGMKVCIYSPEINGVDLWQESRSQLYRIFIFVYLVGTPLTIGPQAT